MNVLTRTIVTVPPLDQPTNQLPVAALTVEDLKQELKATAAELTLQARELDVLKRNPPMERHRRFQKLATRLSDGQFNSGGAFFTLSVMGAIAGAAVGFGVSELMGSKFLGWSVFWACTGAGAAIAPVADGIITLAERQTPPPPRMVELGDLAGALGRFRGSEGVGKVQITSGLEAMRSNLEAEKLLSPEARHALRQAVEEGNALGGPAASRARPLAVLARLLAEPLDAELVESTRLALAQVPEAERATLAEATRQLVFNDRKRVASMPYQARNDLHDLLTGTSDAASAPGKAEK